MSLECCICTHDFDTVLHKPLVGACGHSICAECFPSIHLGRCPSCQHEQSFQAAVFNYQLVELIDLHTNEVTDLHSMIQSLNEAMDDLEQSGADKLNAEMQEKEGIVHQMQRVLDENNATLADQRHKIEDLKKLVVEERIRAQTHAPVIFPLDSWKCIECSETVVQSKARICVDCCKDAGCYSLLEDGEVCINPEMTDTVMLCAPCCLDGHHNRHETTPYLPLKLKRLATTDFSAISDSIERLASVRISKASESVISAVGKFIPMIGVLRKKACAQKTMKDYESVRDKADSLRVEMEQVAMAHEDTCRRLIADIEGIAKNNDLLNSSKSDTDNQNEAGEAETADSLDGYE